MKKLIVVLFFGIISSLSLIIHASPKADRDLISHYNALQHRAYGLNPKVLKLALRAYEHARVQGLDKKHILTVIDYSKPSTQRRLWVLDLNKDKVAFTELVSHGVNSGDNRPSHFSNRSGSKESSIGLYKTAETYYGGHGYSLRLKGLEGGYNSNAYRRNVVIHGAWYVSNSFAHQHGYLGRSWGCPALSLQDYKPVIRKIKGGTLVFAYYPNKQWLRHSHYLHA